MPSPLWSVQRMVYSALINSPFAALVANRIYDGGPLESEAATLPYCVIGECNESADPMVHQHRRQVNVLIHLYSSYRGGYEVRYLGDALCQALDHQPPSPVDAWQVDTCFLENAQTLRDFEDQWHGVYRFRLIVTQRP